MVAYRAGKLADLRARVAGLEGSGRQGGRGLPFGDARIDGAFPQGGLPLGQWHEFTGEGMEGETCAAPAALASLMAAPLMASAEGGGEAVWILRRGDLFGPGLAGLGFPVGRLIQVCARNGAEVLAVAEDALTTAGVAVVLAEVEGLDLVAGRRLQLACEKHGATGFMIHRRPHGRSAGAGQKTGGSAAATRWRIAQAASEAGPGGLGLGPPRWRAHLERCRGGRTGAWLLEARNAYTCEDTHGAHALRLVAELGDQRLVPAAHLRLAG